MPGVLGDPGEGDPDLESGGSENNIWRGFFKWFRKRRDGVFERRKQPVRNKINDSES